MNATEHKLAKPKWYGLYAADRQSLETFWTFQCPCGVKVSYPLNEMPTETTKHPCEDPDHWTVKVK